MPPDTKTRILVYGVTWVAALMITAPFAVQLLPLFPLGLFLALTKPPGGIEVPLAIFGWLTYAIHAVFFFRTSSRKFYFAAYAVLVLMLTTNIAGCRKVLEELATIH